MKIFFFLKLYTLPCIFVMFMGVAYEMGMLYIYEPVTYQKLVEFSGLAKWDFLQHSIVREEEEKVLQNLDSPHKENISSPVQYEVLVRVLNVRVHPRVDSKIASHLYRGQRILITHVEKSWGSLVDEKQNLLGYVFLNPVNAVKVEDENLNLQSYSVSIRALNVRANPDIKSKTIEKVYFGQIVWLEDLGNGWGKVNMHNTQGYVYMKWLKKQDRQ